MDMREERRTEVRVSASLQSELLVEQHHFMGQTENISLGGALITIPGSPIPAETESKQGKIWFLLNDEDMIEFDCKVVRIEGNQVAVVFIRQEIQPTVKLRSIIDRKQ